MSSVSAREVAEFVRWLGRTDDRWVLGVLTVEEIGDVLRGRQVQSTLPQERIAEGIAEVLDGDRLSQGVSAVLPQVSVGSGRVAAESVSEVYEALTEWVDQQPDAEVLRGVLSGHTEGDIGDALLLRVLREHSKVYPTAGYVPTDEVANNAFLLGADIGHSGAAEVNPQGDWIRVPVVGPAATTAGTVMIFKAALPAEVRGVPAFRVAEILQDRVDLSALSESTRAYLRAYLRAYIEDDEPEDVVDRAALIGLAIDSLPLTRGGLMGLADLRQQAMDLLGRDWVDHPLAMVIARKQEEIEASTGTAILAEPGGEGDADGRETPLDKLPKWAQDAYTVAGSAEATAILVHHGQAALQLQPPRYTRDFRLVLVWTGGGRQLVVNAWHDSSTGMLLRGEFIAETGERVPQSRWRVRRVLAHTLLPDAWMDKVRSVGPKQDPMIPAATLAISGPQRREVDRLIHHARGLGATPPVLRVDDFGRVFVSTTLRLDGHEQSATVVVPKDGRAFAWEKAPEGRVVSGWIPRVLASDRQVARRALNTVEALAETSIPKTRPPRYGAEWPGVQRTDQNLETWSMAAHAVYQKLREYGYRLDQLKGCGVYGCAYLGRPYIVKITGDEMEAANARYLQSRGNPIPGVVQCYAVFGFPDVSPGPLYALALEVLEPPPAAVRRWVNDWRLDFLQKRLKAKEITAAEYKAKAADARAAAPKGDVSVEAYIDAIEQLYVHGIKYQDGHGDNVMVRVEPDGRKVLVAIDLGYSGTPGAQIPILD